VVDSGDRDRIAEAGDELRTVTIEEELKGVPMLIFANKQDLPNVMTVGEIIDRLQLRIINDRPWYVQGCSAHSGMGLHEGLDWLANNVKAD